MSFTKFKSFLLLVLLTAVCPIVATSSQANETAVEERVIHFDTTRGLAALHKKLANLSQEAYEHGSAKEREEWSKTLDVFEDSSVNIGGYVTWKLDVSVHREILKHGKTTPQLSVEYIPFTELNLSDDDVSTIGLMFTEAFFEIIPWIPDDYLEEGQGWIGAIRNESPAGGILLLRDERSHEIVAGILVEFFDNSELMLDNGAVVTGHRVIKLGFIAKRAHRVDVSALRPMLTWIQEQQMADGAVLYPLNDEVGAYYKVHGFLAVDSQYQPLYDHLIEDPFDVTEMLALGLTNDRDAPKPIAYRIWSDHD